MIPRASQHVVLMATLYHSLGHDKRNPCIQRNRSTQNLKEMLLVGDFNVDLLKVAGRNEKYSPNGGLMVIF